MQDLKPRMSASQVDGLLSNMRLAGIKSLACVARTTGTDAGN